MGQIVIGNGQAGTWAQDASAVTRSDKDLLEAARRHSLYERGAERGICSLAGELHGDAWLLVVESDGATLDADPAVVAYCAAPETLIPWREVRLWTLDVGDAGERGVTYERPNADGVCGDRTGVLRVLREYRDGGSIDGWVLDNPMLHSIDADTLSDAGPRVDQIDWTGLDEASATA